MNPDVLSTPDEALSHLFFHCCFKDNTITEAEIKAVSEKLVATGLNKELNFKDEVIRYRSYRNGITNEDAYLKDLINLIKPTHTLALYSYCVELCLSDGLLQTTEDGLLQKVATALDLETTEETITRNLMIQRKAVATQKLF